MKVYILFSILILSTLPTKAQLKITSIDFKIGQTYVSRNNYNVFTDPQNPSITIYSSMFLPGYNAKIGLSKIIHENNRKEVVLNAMLNYWNIEVHKVYENNEEDQTSLHFLYAGSELHYIPYLPRTRWRASLGVGLYGKIYGNASNKDFDPNDYTKLLNAKNKPVNPFIIANAIVGIGYSNKKISYWLRYNYSLNPLLKRTNSRVTGDRNLTQATIGVSYKLGKKVQSETKK